jgi:hypothetical protein
VYMGAKCSCKECNDTVDVFSSHYMIGLNVICAANKPGLDVRMRRI